MENIEAFINAHAMALSLGLLGFVAIFSFLSIVTSFNKAVKRRRAEAEELSATVEEAEKLADELPTEVVNDLPDFNIITNDDGESEIAPAPDCATHCTDDFVEGAPRVPKPLSDTKSPTQDEVLGWLDDLGIGTWDVKLGASGYTTFTGAGLSAAYWTSPDGMHLAVFADHGGDLADKPKLFVTPDLYSGAKRDRFIECLQYLQSDEGEEWSMDYTDGISSVGPMFNDLSEFMHDNLEIPSKPDAAMAA